MCYLVSLCVCVCRDILLISCEGARRYDCTVSFAHKNIACFIDRQVNSGLKKGSTLRITGQSPKAFSVENLLTIETATVSDWITAIRT